MDLMDFFEAVSLNVQKITHRILGRARHIPFKAKTDNARA